MNGVHGEKREEEKDREVGRAREIVREGRGRERRGGGRVRGRKRGRERQKEIQRESEKKNTAIQKFAKSREIKLSQRYLSNADTIGGRMIDPQNTRMQYASKPISPEGFL